MNVLECFALSYKNSIMLFSAVGTWLAVLAALWISYKSTAPKLKVRVDKSVFIPSEAQLRGKVDKELCEDGVSVSMQNVGNVSIYISYWSFTWSLMFYSIKNIKVHQNPASPDFRSQDIELKPGQGTSIFISLNIKEHKEMLDTICKKNKLPNFMKKYVRLYVTTQDGKRVKGSIGTDYKKEFLSN